MARRILLLVVLPLLPTWVRADPGNQEKLRQLARLPLINVFEYNIGKPVVVDWKTWHENEPPPSNVVDIRDQIAQLTRESKQGVAEAARQWSLGDLYHQLHETASARAAWEKAENLYRAELIAQPHNIKYLTNILQILQSAGKKEEAAKVYQEVIQAAPRESRCWLCLADYQTQQYLDKVLGPDRDPVDGPSDWARLIQQKQSLSMLEEGTLRYREAEAFFAKALAAGPANADFYRERAWYRFYFHQVSAHLAEARGQDGQIAIAEALAQALADIHEYCRLEAQDPDVVGTQVVFEMMIGQMMIAEELGNFLNAWNRQPLVIQRSVRKLVHLLEEDPATDRSLAAKKLELAGTIKYIIWKDSAGAEKNWRRAITLDPRREQAWGGLSCALFGAKRFAELIPLLRERSQYHDTPNNRLQLAKVYERLNQIDKAEEQVQAAVNLDPENAIAQLAVAAIWLRQGIAAEKIEDQLTRVEKLLAKFPSERDTQADFAVTRAIHFALQNRIPEARQQLLQAFLLVGDHQQAKDLSAALEAGRE